MFPIIKSGILILSYCPIQVDMRNEVTLMLLLLTWTKFSDFCIFLFYRVLILILASYYNNIKMFSDYDSCFKWVLMQVAVL